MTQKNSYYGATSNAAGAWWGGLAAIVAGVFTLVHLDKTWVIVSIVFTFAALAITLAGAAIDGIMAVQFWANQAMCVTINQNVGLTSGAAGVLALTSFFSAKNIGQVNTALNSIGVGLVNGLIDKSFTNTNQNTDLYKWYALFCGLYTTSGGGVTTKDTIDKQVANLFSQDTKQVFCVNNGYDNLGGLDPFTRQSQYCYQVATQNPLNINDLARILPVLQASVAFNVLAASSLLTTGIILAWLYTWIHPSDNQGGPMLVGVEPKGLLPPSPLAPPYPALPPAPPAPPASNIDLKPLGQIK